MTNTEGTPTEYTISAERARYLDLLVFLATQRAEVTQGAEASDAFNVMLQDARNLILVRRIHAVDNGNPITGPETSQEDRELMLSIDDELRPHLGTWVEIYDATVRDLRGHVSTVETDDLSVNNLTADELDPDAL